MTAAAQDSSPAHADGVPDESDPSDAVLGADLERLLDFLRESRNLDLTGYKRASLERRVRKRMAVVDAADFEQYRDLIEADPAEQARLVDAILINVTSFFRDRAAWEALAEQVVPAIVDSRASGVPIRVWSAGCASGEEAYSLAMVFAEHLGIDGFIERVKIFATDVDDDALAQARAALYPESRMEAVSAERRERFFTPTPEGFQFRADLRRCVVFGHHDVTRDAPISRVDLLVCRNVLIYLLADTQKGVLDRFHYALRDGGRLFLGRAESILAHASLFRPIVTSGGVFAEALPSTTRQIPDPTRARPTVDDARLGDLALAATPVAQLVVDLEGRLAGANTKARSMFGITSADLMRPLGDLEVARRPVELKGHIEQAYAGDGPVMLRWVQRTLADGRPQFLEVIISALEDAGGVDQGVSVTYSDVTELGRAKDELERYSSQLTDSNRALLGANEGLETSNEELQSSNEELETTNEELQSANEELETTNEELSSANEELETMNEELIEQTARVERGQKFLDSILDSLAVGVVVLDGELDVVVWNVAMEDLFGVRAEETEGRSFLALDIGLPVAEIAPDLHAVFDAAPEDIRGRTVDAINRRGRPLRCRVVARPLRYGTDADRRLVVLVDPLSTAAVLEGDDP